MRGVDRESVAFPFARGKSHPGVRRARRRMRTPIHPDSAVLFVSADVLANRDHPLRLLVLLFPDPHIERSTVNVGDDVNVALMFGYSQTRRAPGQAPSARSVGDGNSEIIGERRIANVFLVRRGSPLT